MSGGRWLMLCSTCETAGLRNRRECRFWCKAYSQQQRNVMRASDSKLSTMMRSAVNPPRLAFSCNGVFASLLLPLLYCSLTTRRQGEHQLCDLRAHDLSVADFLIFFNFTPNNCCRLPQRLEHTSNDLNAIFWGFSRGVHCCHTCRHRRVAAVSPKFHPPCVLPRPPTATALRLQVPWESLPPHDYRLNMLFHWLLLTSP
ncbi:hypothetical protein IW262DRAFT_537658 [Armillaria fumosa]|nr:hypothetical protein IW262DRAFT_537658 [Armillaria fumosa]